MIPVVEGAAAEVASLIASPIPLKSADAVANASGAMFRKDDILGSNHLRATHNQGNNHQDSGQNSTPNETHPQQILRFSFRVFSRDSKQHP